MKARHRKISYLGRGPRVLSLVSSLFVLCFCGVHLRAAGHTFDRLRIMVPGTNGGGWDQTARAAQRAILDADGAQAVDIIDNPGAGGAIGLAQFLSGYRGDDKTLLIGGLSMVGSIRAEGASLSLAQTTPIARLTGDYLVVAVPASSPFNNIRELIEAFRRNPSGVSWASDHEGSPENLLVALIARALGIPSTEVNYFPSPGAGAEMKALLNGEVSAGAIGYGEGAEFVNSGKLRILAVSSERRLPDVAIPTLKETGIDLVAMNWRGIFGAPGISAEQRSRLEQLVQALVRQDSWRAAVAAHRWVDMYLSGDEFARFLALEQARMDKSPDLRVAGRSSHGFRMLSTVPLIAAGMLIVALSFALYRFLPSRTVRPVDEPTPHIPADVINAPPELRARIDLQFKEWGLTSAETDVAVLMLKGLRHKEIAQLRNTSERTVRHQALAIYEKAGLDGRSDLAAHFLQGLFPDRSVTRPIVSPAH
jgi:putative tricarboxylic transport membrane protein